MIATATRVYSGKRAFDCGVLAVVALPALLVGIPCALAIKLTSRGPVFFRQERVGIDGRQFQVIKFRTMFHGPRSNPVFPHSDRITVAGKFLRRFSLDELPQLFNVVKGDMSLVGPRPALPYQVERYDQRQLRRLAVRPGVTGLAQVRGRNGLTWAERIEHDLEYVERQSLLLDFKILAVTVIAAVRGSGVQGHPVDDPIAAPDDRQLA